MTSLVAEPAIADAPGLASERLLQWQRNQFERKSIQTPASGDAPDPVVNARFFEFQRAVWSVLNDDVLVLLGSPVAYITALHPYEPVYSTAALIGDWPEWRRGVWRRWMGRSRQRNVSEGLLFRRAYGLGFGEPLVIPEPWKESTDFISRDTRDLDLGYAAVIPLLHQTSYLGLLTIGFASQDLRDSALDAIHRIAQLVLVPLLQPDSPSISERSLIEGVTRIYRPIMWRVRETLATYSTHFDAKARFLGAARGNIKRGLTAEGRQQVDAELGDIQRLMESAAIQLLGEGERGLSLVHGLAPGEEDSPFVDDFGCSTAADIDGIINQVVESMSSEIEGEFDALIRPSWVEFSASPDCLIPLSPAQAQVILEELLRNSFRAIAQQFSLLADDPALPITGPEVVARYVAVRGHQPAVRIRVEKAQGGAESVLTVWDNGIGMPAEILVRALELGFSTKTKGTGTGLNIVRALSALRGGTVHVRSSAVEERTKPQDVYTVVEVRFINRLPG